MGHSCAGGPKKSTDAVQNPLWYVCTISGGENGMDLGISGRKAIVCASSRGLGRSCAMALAQEGCEVVVNGRDKARLESTAEEIRRATGAKVTAVAADVGTPDGQAALF